MRGGGGSGLSACGGGGRAAAAVVGPDWEGAGAVVVAHGEGGGMLVAAGHEGSPRCATDGLRLDERAEVRKDPDMWGPPARERERGGERESRARPTARPGRGGDIFFLFYFSNLFV